MLTAEQKMLIQDEPEQRERIAEMIDVFTDRDRVEVIAEYQGSLLTCSFWRGTWPDPETGQDWDTVALCLDLDLPGQVPMVDRRDNPLAIGFTAIEQFTGTEVYADLEGYPENTLSCALVVDMLMEEKTND